MKTTTISTLMKRQRVAAMLGACVLACAAGARWAVADAPAAAPAAPAAAVPAEGLGPQELVQNSAQKMLTELDANRAMYRNDPKKLDNLVGTVLLPNFDTAFAAQRVLGQNWRTATADQRKRFVDAFYHSLLRNYGSALVDFTADKMVVLPFRGDPNSNQATVRTEVKRENGTRVAVLYSLHKTDTGWKAWDVVIEGISYVKSFRTDFGSEVEQKGLDEVINRLEAGIDVPGKKTGS
jgi:phospholipid transport system substrate-binding protein